MPCPSHTLWLCRSNYTWRSVQIMKLLFIHFLQPLFGRNILLSTLFSNITYLNLSLQWC
jgi:hypothetical protein